VRAARGRHVRMEPGDPRERFGVGLRVQPAAEHGRRQKLAPQFGRWLRGAVRTRSPPWQRHHGTVRRGGPPVPRSVLRARPGCTAPRTPDVRPVAGRHTTRRHAGLGQFRLRRCPPIRRANAAIATARATAFGRTRGAAVFQACVPLLPGQAPFGLVALELLCDRGEDTLPEVFGNRGPVDAHGRLRRVRRTGNPAGKRRNTGVIYHAATPRRPAHERDACLHSGTYIARLIQPKSRIVATKLPKVRIPLRGAA
jgi:hypothetical protein